MYCIHTFSKVNSAFFSMYLPSPELMQTSDVLIDMVSETTINITLNKIDTSSKHVDQLLVVWYDRDDVKHHLKSKMFPVTSTVDHISIHIIEERNYTVAVFCTNSMYPCAIKTFGGTVELVYSGHPSEAAKWLLYTGGLFIEVFNIYVTHGKFRILTTLYKVSALRK